MGSDIGLFGLVLDQLIVLVGAIASGVVGLFLILRQLNKKNGWYGRFKSWIWSKMMK